MVFWTWCSQTIPPLPGTASEPIASKSQQRHKRAVSGFGLSRCTMGFGGHMLLPSAVGLLVFAQQPPVAGDESSQFSIWFRSHATLGFVVLRLGLPFLARLQVGGFLLQRGQFNAWFNHRECSHSASQFGARTYFRGKLKHHLWHETANC